MIHGILPVQFTCLTVFFHNLSPSFPWSTSWPGILHLIPHTFLHPIIVFFVANAHTNATCFAVVMRLCHLILVSLSTLTWNSILYLNATHSSNHSHLCATSFYFLTGQVSLSCNILLCTQLLYNLPLTVNDISLMVSNGTNCLNLFHPMRILVSTAASASPSTLNMSLK